MGVLNLFLKNLKKNISKKKNKKPEKEIKVHRGTFLKERGDKKTL